MTVTEAAHDLYLLVAVLGLALVVSHAGMPVLAASAFVAVGAVGAMQLERHGLPIGSGVLLAIAGGAAAGALTGALVARADGPAIALSTWALAWLAYTALLAFPGLSGGAQGLTRPVVDHLETPLGVTLTLTPTVHLVVAAVLCAAALWSVARLRAGPAGLDAAALRDDAELAASLGTPVVRRRVALMAVAGAMAAAAGAGSALLLGVAAPADLSPLLALQLFAAVIVGGTAPAAGPLLGFAVIVAIPRLADALIQAGVDARVANGVITAALLVAAIWLRPYVPARTPWGQGPAPAGGEGGAVAAAELDARCVASQLGGVEILRGVDLALTPGRIHALIGPNGSGKTTVLRILAGALTPTGGTLRLGGRDLTGAGEAAMVRAGVVRTFQRTAGFAGLSPYRQVRAAVQGGRPVRFAALAHFAAAPAPGVEAEQDRRAWGALALVGLTERAHAAPASLSVGELRLLQVARAAATGAGVLLLDEPAAAMNEAQRARLLEALRALAGEGRAVLVVEHDLRLVAGAADDVTVLDDGRVVAHGAPDAVIGDAEVRRVYLGVA